MREPPDLSGVPSGPLTAAAALAPHRVLWRYWLADHAWLRAVLPNYHRVDATLYRCGHPGRRTLTRARADGVVSVLSLRGGADNTPNILERALAQELGLELRFLRLRTALLPAPETLLALASALREMPKPMLVHCKSGADRTGLAVTLYRHVILGEPIDAARRALHWRYGHWAPGNAGVIHRMLDAYAAAHAETGIGFEAWIADGYDPAALQS